MGMALKAYDAVGDLFLLTTISLSSKYLSDELDLDFFRIGNVSYDAVVDLYRTPKTLGFLLQTT